MDALLSQARTIYEGEITFPSQRLTERITYTLLTLTGLIAFLTGFFLQNIYYTLYIGAVGTLLTFVIVVPPWPVYKKGPEVWLPKRRTTTGMGNGGFEVVVDGRKVG